jgi:CelD/BcsL family acetyltransferase involved in cellulose biosynthesis
MPTDGHQMGHDSAGGSFAVLGCSHEVIEEWDRLARDVGSSPFTRPGWVLAWSAAFGHPVHLASVRSRGQLRAALPVVVARHRVRTATDWHVPWVEGIALDIEAHAELIHGLDRTFRRVSLDFVRGTSVTARLATMALSHRPVRRITRLSSPYVDTTTAWDGYEAALSTKKLREMRRRQRRLASDVGTVGFEIVDGAGDWESVLAAGTAVEASGWKGTAGSAVTSDPATESFYRSVAQWAAREKLLQIAVLRAGDSVVAFDLALSDGFRTWLLKTGYDDRFAPYSPGTLLRYEVLKHAFGSGLDSYEFTGEAEPWKTEWTAATRPVEMIDFFARGVRGALQLGRVRLERALRVRARRLAAGSRTRR